MKKIILLIIGITMLSLFSLSESKAQFSAGLRLGVNASKYIVKGSGSFQPNSTKFVPGVHIGAYFRVAFKTKYRIEADLLFSTKGAVSNGTLYSNGTFYSEKYYNVPFYIDVPVLFNYKPIAGLYVEAGVQPSFALAQLNFSANTTSTVSSPSDNYLKSVLVAPIVGVGYEFKKVSLGLRATFGGSNVSTLNTSSLTERNLCLMTTFGFKF